MSKPDKEPQRFCDHGQHFVGLSKKNPALYDGFFDTVTRMFVCWSHASDYYKTRKTKLDGNNL